MSEGTPRKKNTARLTIGENPDWQGAPPHKPLADFLEWERARRGWRISSSPLFWALGIAALLATSSGLHIWREGQLKADTSRSMAHRFRLEQLPMTIGSWQGTDTKADGLDPKVARTAAAQDAVVRTYRSRTTGETITALVAFGRAEDLVALTPAACYQAAGYRIADGPREHKVDVGRASATLGEWILTKPMADSIEILDVYSAFRYDDQWIPDASSHYSRFRRAPGMFRVLLQRRVDEHERGRSDNPYDTFLSELLLEIEHRLPDESVAR